MKMKLAVAFFAGAAFALAGVLIAGVVTPYAKAQDSGQTNTTASDGGTSLADLMAAFQKARLDIRDPDIGDFYDRLIAGYGISEAGPNGGQGGAAVPDIENIQHVALTLPLQEAGKQIKDPDIAGFYRKFLSDAGLGTIPTATGAR